MFTRAQFREIAAVNNGRLQSLANRGHLPFTMFTESTDGPRTPSGRRHSYTFGEAVALRLMDEFAGDGGLSMDLASVIARTVRHDAMRAILPQMALAGWTRADHLDAWAGAMFFDSSPSPYPVAGTLGEVMAAAKVDPLDAMPPTRIILANFGRVARAALVAAVPFVGAEPAALEAMIKDGVTDA